MTQTTASSHDQPGNWHRDWVGKLTNIQTVIARRRTGEYPRRIERHESVDDQRDERRQRGGHRFPELRQSDRRHGPPTRSAPAGRLVKGRVDGGGGWNTLDDSQTNANLTINLLSGQATSTGGVARIREVLAAAATRFSPPTTRATCSLPAAATRTLNRRRWQRYSDRRPRNDTLIGSKGNGSRRDILIGGSGVATLQGAKRRSADRRSVVYYNERPEH